MVDDKLTSVMNFSPTGARPELYITLTVNDYADFSNIHCGNSEV